ncbi:MAG: polyprenol monophosphomannose synthase [Elusimicrobiota bacterium]|jgi:dolichol-phosphate mannosyltransferase|nr:polyprenol monophosphomannose synthase [Elusimicrobiota bacterium]
MDTVAVLPTYNEASNIKQVIEEILNCPIEICVLIVDDMSPDGTYKIVQEMAAKNPKINLLLRKEKRGRGYAGIDGFKRALDMGAKYIVEMDADGSHNPQYIPALRKAIENCDAVIGSRYISGGKDEARNLIRKIISNLSRMYLSFVIGTKIKDPTSGYRIFKRETLEKFIDKLKASDPFIVTEIVYYLKKNKCLVQEYPIEFKERLSGESKLKASTLLKYLFKVIKLRLENI